MANNEIQKYADMVNLQMAAEAFWWDWNNLGKDTFCGGARGDMVAANENKWRIAA